MKPVIRYSLVSVLALATASAAFAQDSENANEGLQDIVVTARRSSETMQSVPVAVTALGAQFIERQNISDPTSIPQFAPNLTVAQQPSSLSAASVFIRGIGNNEPSAVSEQGVGIYLDGVYLARAAGAVFDLVDMERIEVLRGPQGTLFGRNTIGGAMQLVSKRPSEDMHFTGKVGYGRFNDWYARARVDTGRIEGTPFKLSISGQHRQADGYFDNTLTPASLDPGSLKANSVAVALEADLGKLTANVNFDFDERQGTPSFFQVVATTPLAQAYYSQSPSYGGDPFLSNPNYVNRGQQAGFVDTAGNYRYNAKTRIWGTSLTLAYEASDALTVKSITGYRKFFQDTILNLSGNGVLKGPVVDLASPTFAVSTQTVVPYSGNNAPQKQHQFSEELQALGKIGDFNYLAGLYYFKESSSEHNRQGLTIVAPVAFLGAYLGGLGFPQAYADSIATAVQTANPTLPLVGLNLNPVQAFSGTAESKAAFGQVSWKPSALDQKLEITVGGRYTEDKKTILLAGDVVPNQAGAAAFHNFSWLVSASYRFTPDVMLYARASTGYRSGGINPRAGVINAFQPEKALGYEAGLKSEFFNHKLRFNLAGYTTQYDNMQIQQFAAGSGGATSLIVNAGKVELKGFEAELTATPVAGLVFDGSVGYVNTKYKTFLFRDPTTNVISDVAGLAKPVYTPDWSLHLGAEYSAPVGFATARVRLDYSYRTEIYFNALNATTPFNENIKAPSEKNLRARASLEEIALGGGKLDLGIWGDNLTNQHNLVYGIDFGSLGFAGANFRKPVSYGIDARIAF